MTVRVAVLGAWPMKPHAMLMPGLAHPVIDNSAFMPRVVQLQVELKGMADRIISMRQQLFDALQQGKWLGCAPRTQG